MGFVDCRVTLIIEDILALATDKKSKSWRAKNSNGLVLTYQLDSIKKKESGRKAQVEISILDCDNKRNNSSASLLGVCLESH